MRAVWAIVATAAVIAVDSQEAPAAPRAANPAAKADRGSRAPARSAFDLPVAPLRLAWSSPLAQRNDLFAVRGTPDGLRVWAVGATGTILSLRGAEARLEESGTEVDLYDVWIAAADDVWAVGERGTILHGDGRRWTRVASGTQQALYAVWGRNAHDLWVGGEGGTILHGDGARWTISPTGSKGPITGFAACGPGTEVCALDLASLLPAVDLTSRPCNDPDGDCAADEPQEMAGDRVLRWSGGRWSSDFYAVEQPLHLADAGGALWLAEEHVLSLVHGSKVERAVHASAGDDLVHMEGVWIGGDTKGWLVGERCRQDRPSADYLCDQGGVWRFDGKSAALRPEIPSAPLNAVWASARGGAVAVGVRGLIMRFDGASWTTVSRPPTDDDIRAVWVGDAVPAAPAGNPLALLIHQDDSGSEVVDLAVGNGSRSLWRAPKRTGPPVAPPPNDAGTLWLIGDCEALCRGAGSWTSFPTSSCTKNAAAATALAIGTSDAWLSNSGALDHWNGKTWTSIPSPARDPPGTDIWGARPDDVWITAGPSLLHWNGQALALVSPPTEIKPTDWLSAVWGSDTNDVWAAAYSGAGTNVIHWDGTRWLLAASFGFAPPRRLRASSDSWVDDHLRSRRAAESRSVALWGTSSTDVWLAGPNGVVLRFDGARWTRVRTGTRVGLLGVGGAQGRVVAVGMGGVILEASVVER